MKKLDVYDFDGTIYNGDSSIDFFFYAIKKKKSLIKYIPIMFIFTLLKKLNLVSTKKFKEKCFLFIKDIDNLDNLITQFWEEKKEKINKFFLENLTNQQEEDKKRSVYVISASPEFLVKPYISQYENVNLIATKMDKKGNIIGENCKGNEKIDRLKKEEKAFEIENFYTDSLDDLPLVEIAQNTYYVHNGNVENWDTKKVKDKKGNKKARLIFLMFFIFYIIIGVQLSYNYNLNEKIDFMFGSDTVRVVGDMTDIFGNHYRLSVHPLFVLLLQPIYFILSGITQDKALALILLSSAVSAISVALMYKIFELCSKSEKASFWLSICYGLTFSTIIFATNIEVYNIAALGLILLWYFIIDKIKGEWNKSDFVILIALGIFSLSITITNFVIFLIGCLTLLIAKKIKFSKLILANIFIVLLFLILNRFQFLIWRNTPLSLNLNTVASNESLYMNWNLGKDNFKNVIKNDIYNSIISTDLYVGTLENTHDSIKFQSINLINKIVITIFLGFIAIFTIKNFKKNLPINIGIILCLAFNFVLHLIYGNDECFLYSQHFVYLIFLLFGINCLCEDNKRIKLTTFILTILLLLFEVILNSQSFLQILEILTTYAVPNYYAINFRFYKLAILTGIIAIFLIAVLSFILYFTKKAIHSEENSEKFKFIIYIIIFILLFESIFVALKTIPQYIQINYNESETVSSDLIINKDYTVFNKDYESDVTAYLDYVNEYKDFIEQYKCTIYDQIPDIEFYLFGMGNRRKILFKENKLIDIETKEIIEQFDVDKCLIIPNEYTVLIKEKNGQFDKIFENQNGVFISKNGKSNIIEGTNVDINIYTFDTQKYKNIKKVLYGEILFNIKDSKIYPNIIVYDETWYRDAAMACMVLKQTNNTNLISDWVKSITEVYDGQNGGKKEPDNLGELLQILSTQEERNAELISKIENEANRLANENPNGYYIYGLTDSSNEYKYQNMWYDFGMKSIGKNSEFKYDELDDEYSNLAWWIDKNATNIYENTNYPYLAWANYHASSTKEKKLIVSNKIYPLSWERNANYANYNEMSVIDDTFVQNKISPVHIWSASEMLLFILDETGNLNNI